MAKKKKEIKQDYIQLELIPLTEVEKLYKEFSEVKESTDKVRRGVFAKVTDLAKKVTDLTCQLESLQHQLIVMNQWMITQLGLAGNVPLQPGEHQEIEFQHITNLNVTSVERSQQLQGLEISDGQSLSA